jgi:ribose transport system ATP-binding protein
MPPILEAIGITKQYPGTLALDHVHLELMPGEIHAVMGENGAGKSTLMKILAGVIAPDTGELRLEGRSIAFTTPHQAIVHGIAIVYQELNMVPTLSVAENIYPGRLPVNRFGMVRYKTLFQNAAQAIQKLNLDLDPRTTVEDLSIANQQLVEIAKALSRDCKVLILDEPTSALTDREADMLLAHLRRLADEGIGILYISHKLKEVFAVADRVTVLRDGKYVGTQAVSETTPDTLIRMMVGRDLGTLFPPKSETIGNPLFRVENFSIPRFGVANTFELRQGEILGFAGLIGAGRTELGRAIFGAEPHTTGQIILNGTPIQIKSPSDAIKHGIGYLPEDRKAAGLFLEMSIRLNVVSTIIDGVSARGFVVTSKERGMAEQSVQRLGISTPSVEQEVRRLSGGNQQKTLVAKWLAILPKILIVDEPTRGIDVGAKREIYFLLRNLAASGVGIIMISSELPEILGMCDRVMVMHEGAIVAEFQASEATEENIIRAASGQ